MFHEEVSSLYRKIHFCLTASASTFPCYEISSVFKTLGTYRRVVVLSVVKMLHERQALGHVSN